MSMNILFLSLIDFDSVDSRGIYQDLLREFRKRGDRVYVISPVERRKKQKTFLLQEGNVTILKLKIGNIQKTNLVEKGISTITIESVFIRAIKKYFSEVGFDLILYSTPPITFCRAIEYVKKRDRAQTYLLLKDIFPQNSVDLGMLTKSGIRGILYRYFRNKEKSLYLLSDYIGCMSPANVDYVIRHNPEVTPDRVEVCPNAAEVTDMSVGPAERTRLREKYGIPADRTVFVYGGNLGRPQGIDFLVECLRGQKDNEDVFFLIVGDGTEYGKLESYIRQDGPANVKLMRWLPREDYDKMVASCDVGMIFLDHRFTIPNFPSRLLAYMQAKLPVLACTDPNTDIGRIIVGGGFGWWCESDDTLSFQETLNKVAASDLGGMGERGFQYLKDHYSAEGACRTILGRVSGKSR